MTLVIQNVRKLLLGIEQANTGLYIVAITLKQVAASEIIPRTWFSFLAFSGMPN